MQQGGRRRGPYLELVHELDCLNELQGKVLQGPEAEGPVAVKPHGFIEGRSQLLKGHANVTSVVEPFSQRDAVLESHRIILL
jgi:hypothetical protein